MLSHESKIAMKGCLNRLPDRIYFDAGIQNFISSTEIFCQLCRFGVLAKRVYEIIRTFENRRRAGETRLGPKSRGNSVARRQSPTPESLVSMLAFFGRQSGIRTKHVAP